MFTAGRRRGFLLLKEGIPTSLFEPYQAYKHKMARDGRKMGSAHPKRVLFLCHDRTFSTPQLTVQMTMRPPPHLPRPPDTHAAMKSVPAGMYAPMDPGQTRYLYNHMMSFHPGGGGPPLGVSGYEQVCRPYGYRPTIVTSVSCNF